MYKKLIKFNVIVFWHLGKAQKGLITTCNNLTLNIMWPNISFIITKGFKSTISENENLAVNGGHIVKTFSCVSLENQ